MDQYTEEQVRGAANAAVALITDEIECDDERGDLLSLMVNATLTVLRSGMATTFEDVISGQFGTSARDYLIERGWA